MDVRKTKILIIGSGPAGYSAAIYAARAGFNPILVTGMTPGGQLTITTDVENYPGFADAIQGPWLMDQMRDQAIHVGTEVVYDYVESVDFTKRPFHCKTSSGTTYIAWCVIIATGAQALWLGLENEPKFRGFGVSGCATCDGFFFRGKNVAVVGGGNTAVEEALYLTNHASHVTLIHRRDALRAERILQERLFAHPKITVLWDHVVSDILGEDAPVRMTGLELTHAKTGEKSHHAFDGLFVAVGHKPATDIFKGQIDMDDMGYILSPPGTVFTNVQGVFAAGDVQERLYRQAVVAAGQGCMAALDAARDIESHPEMAL